MEQLFNFIYGLFKQLYGTDLFEYLCGVTCDGQFLDSQFVRIGWITLIITAVCVLVYYYVIDLFTDFHLVWQWLVSMICTGTINLVTGYFLVLHELPEVGDCYVVTNLDCVLFGLSNMIISLVFFFLLSLVFKWGNPNNRYTPF